MISRARPAANRTCSQLLSNNAGARRGRSMAGVTRSPLAPEHFPALPAVGGVAFAVAETGTRYKNRPDLLLALLAPGTSVAGVLTSSKSRSAPVDWCAANLKGGKARALIVNSGNANAFTGRNGLKTVTEVARALGAQ